MGSDPNGTTNGTNGRSRRQRPLRHALCGSRGGTDVVPVSALELRHGIGAVSATDAAWLGTLPRLSAPLLLLMHHYPLDTPPFHWTPRTRLAPPGREGSHPHGQSEGRS